MSIKVETTVIKKIYPSISELNSIQSNIPCTEDGCGMVFKTQSNFAMHLQKHHKKENLKKEDCIRKFYCPEDSCMYHDKMHFTKIKYLKQHYLKVHADKSHICEQCNKGFATQSSLLKHSESCGLIFFCSDCTYSYSSYESLLTHARRKKHKVLSKTEFTNIKNDPKATGDKVKHAFILPKQTINIIPVVFIKNEVTRFDKECQTESNIMKNKCKSPIKRRSTQQQQTQTCNRKKPKISAETQTTGDCILKLAIQEAKIKIKENKCEIKKCMETQTKNWEKLNQKDTQTYVNFSDLKAEVNLFLDNDNMMHSSSQTSLNNLNIFEDSSFGNCNSQTQTDLIFQDEFLQSTVFTSHIETQTNEDQSLDLCSNMYTQTSDEQLLSELEFTNIQTQTAWPDYDMFVSTETQTLLTHNTKSVLDMALNGREISHMETQTDMEFKQLLEEINA